MQTLGWLIGGAVVCVIFYLGYRKVNASSVVAPPNSGPNNGPPNSSPPKVPGDKVTPGKPTP